PGALFDQRLTAFAGSHNGYDPRNARPGGRLSGGTGLLHPAAWEFWRVAGVAFGGGPAGPGGAPLFRAFWGSSLGAGGFSRPSSGWGRVRCPPLGPPGRDGPPWEG